ncbi:hypothetical protein HOY80DRAFT_986636 [Tuber brumale]|nr:hypothetical protein HOY80DRAFT_986636 [Tuber brumale]
MPKLPHNSTLQQVSLFRPPHSHFRLSPCINPPSPSSFKSLTPSCEISHRASPFTNHRAFLVALLRPLLQVPQSPELVIQKIHHNPHPEPQSRHARLPSITVHRLRHLVPLLGREPFVRQCQQVLEFLKGHEVSLETFHLQRIGRLVVTGFSTVWSEGHRKGEVCWQVTSFMRSCPFAPLEGAGSYRECGLKVTASSHRFRIRG